MKVMSEVTRSLSLDDLVVTAVNAGAPASLAEEAHRVTAQRFRISGRAAAVSERARSYFWGVVRRSALRGGAPTLTESMLALSLADELAAAGHAPEVVLREVARTYGEAQAALVGGSVRSRVAA